MAPGSIAPTSAGGVDSNSPRDARPGDHQAADDDQAVRDRDRAGRAGHRGRRGGRRRGIGRARFGRFGLGRGLGRAGSDDASSDTPRHAVSAWRAAPIPPGSSRSTRARPSSWASISSPWRSGPRRRRARTRAGPRNRPPRFRARAQAPALVRSAPGRRRRGPRVPRAPRRPGREARRDPRQVRRRRAARALRVQPHEHRVRRGRRGRRSHVHRRGAGPAGGRDRTPLRRARRAAPRQDDRRHGLGARGGLHLQCPQGAPPQQRDADDRAGPRQRPVPHRADPRRRAARHRHARATGVEPRARDRRGHARSARTLP